MRMNDFLFGVQKMENVGGVIILLVVFSLFILLGTTISLFAPKKFKDVFTKYVPPFLTVGILGVIYVFARYEGLPGLGTNFFLLLLCVSFVIWVIIVSVWAFRFLPKHIKTQKTEERYKKYLPKSNK